MAQITFIGTGEAFDPNRASSSYLIENKQGSIMVDCGYDAPKSLNRYLSNNGSSLADVPDTVLFTHEHGDHFAGLTSLLMPIWEEINGVIGNRKDGVNRVIQIASSHNYLFDRVNKRMEEDYKGFFERFKKEGPNISFREINPNGDNLYGFNISSALTSHGAPNFAYKFKQEDNRSFAISGDGAFTEGSRTLFKGVDLLIHEGFNVNGSGGKNHASIEQVVDYSIENSITMVYIVHVNRQERRKEREIKDLQNKSELHGIKLVLAEDHQTIEF